MAYTGEESIESNNINRSIGPVRAFHVDFYKKWPGSGKMVEQFNMTLGEFISAGKRDKILKRYGIELQP